MIRQLDWRSGAALLALASPALATDIHNVRPAAMDQPQIYAMLRDADGNIIADADTDSFNLQAYLDTGASGILLSQNTYDLLQSRIPVQMLPDGSYARFHDVGVAGGDGFLISHPISMSLANFMPTAVVDDLTDTTAYTQPVAPFRAQIGPVEFTPAGLINFEREVLDPMQLVMADLDVIGMPAMVNKKVVMDVRPTNRLSDSGAIFDPNADIFDALESLLGSNGNLNDLYMRTYVYDKTETHYRPQTIDTDPGIVPVDRHIKLSYASFDSFTETSAGATAPTMANNPFIGANPVLDQLNGVDDGTPKIQLSFNGLNTQGSFLLDTGAAASMISSNLAAKLHVRVRPGTQDAPVLEIFDPAHPELLGTAIDDQFSLTIGGIGGSKKVAGFYLTEMLVPTIEATLGNDASLNLNYIGAPVLVNDISLLDAQGNLVTLDGIFGMNNLVGTADIADFDFGGMVVPFPVNLTSGAFDWVVFDENAGTLGVTFAGSVPEPASLSLLALGAGAALRRRRARIIAA